MGRINEGIKVSYQQITSVDFTPDIDGAFDILFAEALKDWKPKNVQLNQTQIGYCNVLQSTLN